MTDFLFECFSEEIPARMQLAAAEQLAQKCVAALKEANLPHDSLTHYVSPRHLSIIINGLPEKQSDQTTERKGPKVGAPDAALEGFLRSTGLTKDQLEVRGEGKDACYFAMTETKGAPTKDVLQTIIETILADFHWPKSQRWGAYPISWVRPLQNLCCLFGSEIVPVTFGHLVANNFTYGHRFLAPEKITLSSPADYLPALQKAKVLLERNARKSFIAQALEAAALLQKLSLVSDEGLLEEVTGLVEWPQILCGTFDKSFLELPPEVLISEMRHHQKYFALRDESGALSNRFLIVSNMTSEDAGAAIIHGNQRVLRARLSDGAFFWRTDRERSLDDWAAGLSGVIFHAKLGTMAEKVTRISSFASAFAPKVRGVSEAEAKRAAVLCKADLVTGMVGEFPELQGVMGRYYALGKESQNVADAIRDHYKPVGAADAVPEGALSALIALTDKMDSLAGLFAIGERPTGSKDPYALRRAALGVLRIIVQHELRLPLHDIIRFAAQQFSTVLHVESLDETCTALAHFMRERLKVSLKDEGLRHDIISAAMADDREDDVVRLRAKAIALSHFLTTEDGENLLAAYRRANNIVSAEEKKGSIAFEEPKDTLFEQAEERTLFAALSAVQQELKSSLEKEDYSSAMQSLASLRTSVDAYLNGVMVNVENKNVRLNRLCTLHQIRTRMDNIVNFALIEGSSS